MNQKVLEFRNKNYRILNMIVHHLVKIGVDVAASITDEDINKVVQKVEHEEALAKKQGSVLILGPEFQRCLLEECRALAKFVKDPETASDAYLTISQSLISAERYLSAAAFDDVQKAYWKEVIQNYVESWSDDDERAEFERLLEEDGMDEVIERLMNDDEVWLSIDGAIEYYVSHLK